MALGAGLRNDEPRPQQEFTGIFVCQARLGVWTMAIRANGGVRVPRGESSLVNTIQDLLILLSVTLLAGWVHLKGKITRTAGSHRRMWETCNIRMAIHTSDLLSSMY